MTEAIRRFLSLKQKTCGRMPVGILGKNIKEVKNEQDVSDKISCETVRSGIKTKNTTGNNDSTYSPIVEAEKNNHPDDENQESLIRICIHSVGKQYDIWNHSPKKY